MRVRRPTEALDELQHASELDPAQARYAYVHAIALNSAGRRQEALIALKDILVRHPADRDTLAALVSISREVGDPVSTLDYAQRLAKIVPEDRSIGGLIDELRKQAAPAGR